MKEWLRLQLIEKLKGYPDAQTAIEAIEDPKEKRALLTLAVRRLFNTLGPEDILRIGQDGQWRFEDRPLSKAQQDLLIAEAAQFLNSKLWKILVADTKYQANKRTFILGKTEDDITAGKLWLYTLDVFKTRLQSMQAGKGAFNADLK